MKPVYIVIHDDRFVCSAGTLKLARRHRTGIAGRRIIKHDPQGESIALRAHGGSVFYIHGEEVQ